MSNYERPFTGLTAEIKLNDVPIAYVSGVDLALEKDIIEVLQFGSRSKEKVPAIKDWSADVDGTVALAPGGSQQKLYDAYNNDEEVTVGIFLNDFVYFEGKAYVTSFNINGAPDDKMNLSCTLEGNGAVTLTLPHTYRIVANSGVGGTVTPGGASIVSASGTYQLTIIPAPNFEVDHTIDVTFKTTGGADKTKLRAAIVFADTLTSADYNSASWATLTSALTEAKTTNGSLTASQSTVDTKTEALDTALNGLVAAD